MGKCVVIGLQSTGEARTLEAVENADGDLTDFVSTATGVLQVSFLFQSQVALPSYPDIFKANTLLIQYGITFYCSNFVANLKEPYHIFLKK